MQQSVNVSEKETEMLVAFDGKTEAAAEDVAETGGAVGYCEECGAPIMENEKFCIKCGTPVHHDSAGSHEETSREKSGLQSELEKVFHANKLLKFIWKYAAVFVVYYPIYIIMERIDALDRLVEILDQIGVVAFYGYYIGLIALYSKSNYLPMLIAFAIRFINSFILIFRAAAGPIPSLCRIAILIIAFLHIYKEFRKTEEYQVIKTRLNLETKVCTQCGARAKNNDVFCPQCGNRMEG